jgi:hypothetical protein
MGGVAGAALSMAAPDAKKRKRACQNKGKGEIH